MLWKPYTDLYGRVGTDEKGRKKGREKGRKYRGVEGGKETRRGGNGVLKVEILDTLLSIRYTGVLRIETEKPIITQSTLNGGPRNL